MMIGTIVKLCRYNEMLSDYIWLGYLGTLLYGLSLCLFQDEDIDTKILNFLQGFISDASVQETRGQEVIFDLPHCDAMTMHDLMQGLEERRKDLCVYRYGISATDMEEVTEAIAMVINMAFKLPRHPTGSRWLNCV